MHVVFRADASTQIGTGHVMRCLTLADALCECGAICRFICREHPGHLLELIRQRGYEAIALPAEQATFSLPEESFNNPNTVIASAAKQFRKLGKTDTNPPTTSYAAWLGTDWQIDADQTLSATGAEPVDWLIVDHYALDAQWERQLRPACDRLMVIDDLADRLHDCDVLLDQNFGRNADDYGLLVPSDCTLLCGSYYALLHPEFAALRPYSLQRRAQPRLKQLLITMGGVDKDNITAQVLVALRASPLPAHCEITVVMGATAPWLADVQQHAQTMPWPTTVRVGVTNMGQMMADSDLAIGAAGATSWERCCLGLPTIMVVLAENQTTVANGLAKTGAVQVLNSPAGLMQQLPTLIAAVTDASKTLVQMSQAASSIADGQGLKTVVSKLGA